MQPEFTCHRCGKTKPTQKEGGTGYAKDHAENLICYDCCGEIDMQKLKDLKPKQKICLYWNGKEITNWPGTLKIKPNNVSKGRHNIAGSREDVWFYLDNQCYHGIQYGHNTQILHIKKCKS